MEKEDIVKKIADKCDKRIATAQNALQEAQFEFDSAVSEKEQRINAVNEYFDALEKIEELKNIIKNKPKDI